MKKRIATLCIFVTAITVGLSQHLVINITPGTSKTNLDSLVSVAKKSNVYIKIIKAKYKHGKLVKIKGSVHVGSPTGDPSGTFASDVLKNFKITVDGKKLALQGR